MYEKGPLKEFPEEFPGGYDYSEKIGAEPRSEAPSHVEKEEVFLERK